MLLQALRRDRERDRLTNLALLVLAAGAVLPLLLARLPPLYDYYHWLFEGKLLSTLLVGSAAERQAVRSSFTMVPLPVPNLAAPLGIALLSASMPVLVAGRVFAAAAVLLFGLGFARLVRSVQGRPSIAELMGFPWALGYFLYKGYLSYLFCLGVVFLGIAALHRGGGRDGPRGGRWLALCAVATGVYLTHLIGWVVLAAATLVYAAASWRSSGLRAAARFATTLFPSVILLAWYAVGRAAAAPVIAWYSSFPDKARSMMEPLLLFLRTDPLPPVWPVFWANVAALVALAALLFASCERGGSLRESRPLPTLSALVAAFALLLPLEELSGMGRVDERFVLPALAIAIASIPHRAATFRRLCFATVAILPILFLHVPEYAAASRRLESVNRALTDEIPPGASVLALSLLRPAVGDGCESASGLSVGTPTLKWIGLARLITTGETRVNLMDTSILTRRHDEREPRNDACTFATTSDRALPEKAIAEIARQYPYVALFGCAEDIQLTRRTLEPYYEETVSGREFSVLRNRTRGRPGA